MHTRIKWIGAALVAGGLLMFTRMAPIFAILPEDMAFPPDSTEEMIRLAAIAGPRWQVSHIMGLVAVVLFAIVYAWYVGLLMRLGWKRLGPAMAVVAAAAFGLFGIALLIDGSAVPAAAQAYLSAAAASPMALEQVADTHGLALSFFAPGVFLMFVAMGLLSSPLLHRVTPARWLGVLGQVIAIAAVTAYVTGLAGPHWNNLQIAGTLMLAAFAWHFLLGTRSLFFRFEVKSG
jgi:hypothetical protein